MVTVENYYLGCLAHASYRVFSGGVAAVIAPQRDVDLYSDAAASHNVRIAYVIETRLHADFVSGHRELAERTGAAIYLGYGSGASFPHTGVKAPEPIQFACFPFHFLRIPRTHPPSPLPPTHDLAPPA